MSAGVTENAQHVSYEPHVQINIHGTFESYGRTWICEGMRVFQPRNEDELISFVRTNASAVSPQCVRMLVESDNPASAGSLQVIHADDIMRTIYIDLTHLCGVGMEHYDVGQFPINEAATSSTSTSTVIPQSTVCAHVHAGVTYDQACETLEQQCFSFVAMPDHVNMTVGSVITTGMWNASSEQHILSIRLLTPDGQVLQLSPRDDLFRATVGGHGCTGIVISCYLRVMPLQAVRETILFYQSFTDLDTFWTHFRLSSFRLEPAEISSSATSTTSTTTSATSTTVSVTALPVWIQVSMFPLSEQAFVCKRRFDPTVDVQQLTNYPGGIRTLLSERGTGISLKTLDVARRARWIVSPSMASHAARNVLAWQLKHRSAISTLYRMSCTSSDTCDEIVNWVQVADTCSWSIPFINVAEGAAIVTVMFQLLCGKITNPAKIPTHLLPAWNRLRAQHLDMLVMDTANNVHLRTVLRVSTVSLTFANADEMGFLLGYNKRACVIFSIPWHGTRSEHAHYRVAMDVFLTCFLALFETQIHLGQYIPFLHESVSDSDTNNTQLPVQPNVRHQLSMQQLRLGFAGAFQNWKDTVLRTDPRGICMSHVLKRWTGN